MPDTRPPKKKPAWLTGEEADAPEPRRSPAGRRRGPLAEDDTGEIPATENPAAEEEVSERLVSSPRSSDTATATIPRVTPTQASGAPDGLRGGSQARSGGNSPAEIVQRLRANPGPALIALLVLVVLFTVLWFVFLRGGGEANENPTNDGSGRGEAPLVAQPSPEVGGVDDTGIVFSGLDEGGDKATLQGAGLDWEGSITKKDGAGETITLEGPTAVQVERGFEVDNSDVDSGVYALAQDDGSVLHVATHTYQLVSQQQDNEADEQIEEEITLGTIFDLEGGNLRQSGFYIDRHEPGSPKTLRTYYPGPDFGEKSSYEVSFNAPKGTPVPLLVGYRDKGQQNQQSNQGEE
ncbi:hypothetical protein BH24ACT20_BH24ACT20_00160 [soil metagenome]